MHTSSARFAALGLALASGLSWNAQAVLSPNLNALGRTIHVSTPTSGNLISLQDLQAVITARADLTTAAVLTGETAENTATTASAELANSGNPAKFTFSGPNRYSRDDTAVALAATSGGRFGLIADTNTWNLGTTTAQGVSHFGAIFYNYLDTARLLSVRATFNDGTTETYTSTATTLQYAFVGFKAPEGKWITSILVTEVSGGGWLGFDDVAIVLAPIPGPPLSWDDGALDGLWSSAANWAGDTLPVETNTLEFGASATTTLTNDLDPSPLLSSLFFSPAAPAYTFTGQPISPGILITNSSGKTQTFQAPIALNGDLNVTGNAPVVFEGGVGGSHSLTKNGASSLSLSGPLTFSGNFNLIQGSATISGTQDQFQGSILTTNLNTTTLTIPSGSSLILPATSQLRIGDSGAGTSTTSFVLAGTLESAGSVKFLRGSVGRIESTATLSGSVQIEGVGGYGANLNVPTGGTLYLTTPGPVVMKSGTNDGGRGRLRLTGGQVYSSAGFEMQGNNAIPAQIEFSDNGTLHFTADLAEAASGVNLVFGTNGGNIDTDVYDIGISGSLGGTGAFTKSGAGSLTLSSSTLPSGPILVTSGTLALTGKPLTPTSSVDLTTGATLHLEAAGTQRIAELKIDNIPVASGIYGSPGSGAPLELMELSGQGRLAVGISDPFEAWISQFTTLTTPASQEKSADPDFDGLPNFLEFAFHTNPETATTSLIGKSGIATVNGNPAFYLTVALRTDTAFDGPGDLVSQPVDGLVYQIQGSADLADFTSEGITEVSPALDGGLPDLSEGWTYRTFTLTNPTAKGFLRAGATLAP